MGRRGVQQLTPAQWREALEQQIREKQEQMKESVEQPQRRSQSAPQQDGGEQLATVPGLERAATTGGEATSDGHAVGGRRRVYQQSTREDYLRGLQEQIEEKKRLAAEEERLKEQQSTRRRQSRSEDNDTVAAVATGRRSSGEEGRLAESKDANARDDAKLHLDLQQRLEDAKATASSNQLEAEPCQPATKAEVAADPVVITKIVDFCEELKKQNEDVKRQLLEQHAVLTSLHSTLEADGKAASSVPRRRNSALRNKSADKSQVKPSSSIRKPQMKGIDAKTIVPSKVAPRPRPMRGDTKIPFPSKGLPSSLRAAGGNIVKGFAQEREAQPKSPLRRVEAKADPYDHSLKEMRAKEEVLQLNEMDADSSVTEVQAPPETTTREDREENCTTSDEKQRETKSNCDMNVTSDGHAMSATRHSDSEEECPMDAESKLVHGWECAAADDKPLECTSVSILDGPSSLVSIDRPLSVLFH